MSKRQHTPASAAVGIEHAIRMLEGRWKLAILFHLFGGRKLRFSDLERAIPAISQKMLIQQLRQLERDGIVARIVHAQVPPKVEYHLTPWGQSLCPALDELRAALAGGKPTLLGQLSYADICMAAVLQNVCPVSDEFVPITPAVRAAFTRPDLAERDHSGTGH